MDITDLLWDARPALSVGALSANLMSLATDLSDLESNGARLLHFDVMDGHFAPQITAGPWFVKALKTTLLKDVHFDRHAAAQNLDFMKRALREGR